MDFTRIRKTALRIFIAFLAFTALISIVFIFGEEFGDIQVRILMTSFTISISSICAMSCAAFIERRKMVNLGLTGMTVSVLTGLLVITVIWIDPNNDIFYKLIASMIAASLSFAHAFLLMLPELDKKHEWVQQSAAITITLLLTMIISMIWWEVENEFIFRMLGAVAIVVGLQTLVIPILLKLKSSPDSVSNADETVSEGSTSELHLTHLQGDMYRDDKGKTYEVNPKGD